MTGVYSDQVPDSQFNGAGRTWGMVFTVSAPTTIEALRWWAVTSPQPSNITAGLWRDDTATWLATQSVAGPFADGWNEVAIAPVELATGITYGVAYWKPDGEGPALTDLFAAPLTNGPFTVPAGGGRVRSTNTSPPTTAPPVTSSDFGLFADVSTGEEEPPSAGSADMAVGVDLAVTGGRPSAGTALLAVGAELAVTGGRASVGAAAFVVGVRMDVAGWVTAAGRPVTSFPTGRPVTAFPAGGRAVQPFPPGRPVRSFSEVPTP